MNELKNHGVDDIFIACCDGLKGFPEAIEAVYPKTQVQLCIVHQICHSLRYVNWKQRKTIAADLKLIYGAATRAEAEQALELFAEKWDEEHPTISRSWRANWKRLSVFFEYPVEIRKAIYTTNAIESLNASLRKITKTRRSFPNDEAVMNVLYLALHQASKKWTMPIRNWKPAMAQFEIMN
ncbi:mutator family transposase [Idiomarina sp. 017G]|jgi:transposase-like protein|nr:mutator family transposase [Idiomarina sp. 017G]